MQHPLVVDCAVVGLEDSLKGHVPLALCVLRMGKCGLGLRRCLCVVGYNVEVVNGPDPPPAPMLLVSA